MNKKLSLLDIIINIIIILLSVLVIYWLIKLIIGGSPTLSEFNFGLIVLIITFLIKMYREIGEIKVGITYSFNKIKEDINSINNNIELIKNKLKIKQ